MQIFVLNAVIVTVDSLCYLTLYACVAGAVYIKNRIFFRKKQSSCFEHSSLLYMAAQLRGSFLILFVIKIGFLYN